MQTKTLLSFDDFIKILSDKKEARKLLSASEYDTYRQAQIDSEFEDKPLDLNSTYEAYAARVKSMQRGFPIVKKKEEEEEEGFHIVKKKEEEEEEEGFPIVKKKEEEGFPIVKKEDCQNSLRSTLLAVVPQVAPAAMLCYSIDNRETSTSTSPKSYSEGALEMPNDDECGHNPTAEKKEYKQSEYDFDLSQFTQGLYKPWVKSRELDPLENVVLPKWLEDMPTQIDSDGGVIVSVSEKLQATLETAWSSAEWQSMPYCKPRKGRNIHKVKEAFMQRTCYLFDVSHALRKLPLAKIQDVWGGAKEAETWLELIQTPFTTASGKTYRIMSEFKRHGKGSNRPCFADWDKWLYSAKPKSITLTDKSVIRDKRGYYLWAKRLCASYPALLDDHESYRALDVPSRESVIQRLDELVNVGHKHKGRCLTNENNVPREWLSSKELKQLRRRFVWAEDWLKVFDDCTAPNALTLYSKHRDRHYGPYVGLPSEIRKLFTFQDKPLAWLDYASMHPTLLMLEFTKSKPDSKYDKQYKLECALIHKILGIDRDVIAQPDHNPRKVIMEIYLKVKAAGKIKCEITCDTLKTANLSYYNTRISQAKYSPLDELYKVVLPMFREWLNDIKGLGDSNHKTVSRWLLHKESEVIESITATIRAQGIFCISAHDGIDVDPKHNWQAKQIFSEKCIEFGLPPNISDK